ncbi:hypothetical protein FB45DRAFT_524283 [Roridomyces roridus]|uniref:Uncharacterized protein n=1 Tax=Roridomyces roridus TaxID=1738132 RepID=A0AAD7FN04_9AGAR|nr:hypothetical protein FB45DRAFT_524283 [Roridomyces roridus]
MVFYPLDCVETGGATVQASMTVTLPHLTLTVGHGLRLPLCGLWIAFSTFVRQPTDVSQATLEGRRSRAAHGRTVRSRAVESQSASRCPIFLTSPSSKDSPSLPNLDDTGYRSALDAVRSGGSPYSPDGRSCTSAIVLTRLGSPFTCFYVVNLKACVDGGLLSEPSQTLTWDELHLRCSIAVGFIRILGR